MNHFEDRIYDPVLFDALRDIAFRSNKTVRMIQDADLISGAEYYGEVLKSSKIEAKTRELSRKLWFNNSTLMLIELDLILLILIMVSATERLSEQRIARSSFFLMKSAGIITAERMSSSTVIKAAENRRSGRRQRLRSENTSETRRYWLSLIIEELSVHTYLYCIRIVI